MSMALPKFSVDDAFARVVHRAGGNMVADLLPPKTDLPKNADYVFRDYNVIAELKRLERDQNENDEFREKRDVLYRQWMDEGKVPIIYGRRYVESRNLPIECALELVSLYIKPIKRRIREANEQIKSTKNLINMPGAKGLLVLAHDGDYSLNPEAVLNLVSRSIMGNRYSGIDDLIYITGNMLAKRLGDPADYTVFVHCHRDAEKAVPADLVSRLRTEWGKELESIFGFPMNTIVNPDNGEAIIDSFRHRKARAATRSR
jgi:hypothetical protein